MRPTLQTHLDARGQAHRDKSDPFTYSRIMSHVEAGVGVLTSSTGLHRPATLGDCARLCLSNPTSNAQ